jgi:hypothetical protein
MTGAAKILAVEDEADFELLIRQRFRRQVRAGEFELRFARHGEEAGKRRLSTAHATSRR